MMKQITRLIAVSLAISLWTTVQATEPVLTDESGNVAAHGHDVVAYFTAGEPVPGSTEHSLQWRGAEWHFASEKHLAMFRDNPEKYAPAYGGYCAFGVARGKALASSPQHWSIHDGRLFFNLDAEIHSNWSKAQEKLIAAADEHWPELVEQAAAGSENPSLYDRLGGLGPISVVVDDFIDAMLPDEQLNRNPAIDKARERVPAPYLKYHVTAMVCQVTGGPCQYHGRGMDEAHAHLNISPAEWDRMAEIFVSVLDSHDVPEAEQQELLEIVGTTRSDIVIADSR